MAVLLVGGKKDMLLFLGMGRDYVLGPEMDTVGHCWHECQGAGTSSGPCL